MILAWRRQARVCIRLAEECEDQYLAERLRLMAVDLAAKAEEQIAIKPAAWERTSYAK